MKDDKLELFLGDCLESIKLLPDDSVDSIVTDPPYGLSFMGKRWDYDVPSVEIWAECLRVLKPGGHLLAFAGTRTQHRMAVRIEDAGFEIRDMIAWVYGSGFPKSLDVSKAIDKQRAGDIGEEYDAEVWRLNGRKGQPSDTWQSAEVIGEHEGATPGFGEHRFKVRDTKIRAASEASAKWQGWGTALKPALEPITVARKPLGMTVAECVLEHGTGALNIDGCRVPGVPEPTRFDPAKHGHDGWRMNATGAECAANASPLGRWPANLIHDGSDEVLAGFPAQAGASAPVRGTEASAASVGRVTGERARVPGAFHADTGSAARFFYCAKASRKDRNEGIGGSNVQAVGNGATMRECDGADWSARNGNRHPTVKPTDLMRYLCRLVTPPGGVVLDPFMGSGSTGKAAMLEGFRFIGCELSPEYMAIAEGRIVAARDSMNEVGGQESLF